MAGGIGLNEAEIPILQRKWLDNLQSLNPDAHILAALKIGEASKWRHYQSRYFDNKILTGRSVLPSEIMMDIDHSEWEAVAAAAVKIDGQLTKAKVPHYVAWSGGKGIHIHTFFLPSSIKLSEEVRAKAAERGINVLQIVRVVAIRWITEQAGVDPKESKLDYLKVKWSPKRKGTLIREFGAMGNFGGRKTLLPSIPVSERPNPQTMTLIFPEKLSVWNVGFLSGEIEEAVLAELEKAKQDPVASTYNGEMAAVPCYANLMGGVVSGQRHEAALALARLNMVHSVPLEKAKADLSRFAVNSPGPDDEEEDAIRTLEDVYAHFIDRVNPGCTTIKEKWEGVCQWQSCPVAKAREEERRKKEEAETATAQTDDPLKRGTGAQNNTAARLHKSKSRKHDMEDSADVTTTDIISPGRVLADGTIIEECFDGVNAFYYVCPKEQKNWPHINFEKGVDYQISSLNVRLRPRVDELLLKGKVMLPKAPLEYGEPIDLYDAWITWAKRYYEAIDEHYKLMAAYYLLSAVYDKCPALPEYNFRGPPKSGKSRGLELLRHTCYRGMRASGSLSYSSMFRAIEAWKGTLCINESDMKESDATVEIIKYLNERYEQGGCVWRSSPETYEPQCFDSFGPTVLTSRQPFDDDALESRQIDLETRGRKRKDVPLNLAPVFFIEAQAFRDKLLTFRFRNYHAFENDYALEFEGVSSRLNQILQPLASLARTISDELFEEIKSMAKGLQQMQIRAAALSTDGMIVNAYLALEGQTWKKKNEAGEVIDEKPIRMTADNISKQITQLGGDVSRKMVGARAEALGFRKKKSPDGRFRLIELDSSDRRVELKAAYVPEELADESDESDRCRKVGGHGLESYAPKSTQQERVNMIAAAISQEELTLEEFTARYPDLKGMVSTLLSYGRVAKKPNGALYCHHGLAPAAPDFDQDRTAEPC
jgi:hypothetical protein